ncbi:SPOR domain-containing protein [Crocosphaera sp. XPORK-15E]|uniref:SPOR domain-containing protein n=1 Tax=Crocosphaera sp. XPORK-15E TaxID=3110247 RepID=UPI002B2073A9|nr:SPOR domain-containing protein [Crocosphaera sp. XPORK-15E]MEA5532469.1 SPOR domain-containing protein [Crocosphaera sp. XPORK-15E]
MNDNEQIKEIEKQTAILTISSLDNKDLAIDLVRIEPTKSGIKALADIGFHNASEEIKLKILKALLEIVEQDKKWKDDAKAAIQNMMQKKQLVIQKNWKGEFRIVTEDLTNSNFNKIAEELLNILDEKFPTSPLTTTTTPTPTILQNWAIVIGADNSLESAQWEVQESQNTNIGKSLKNKQNKQIIIFKRGGWFRTVITNFKTKDDAKNKLDEIQKQIRGSSYIVDLESWCPQDKRISKNGYEECQN